MVISSVGNLILTGTPADQIEVGMNGENDFRYFMKFNVS